MIRRRLNSISFFLRLATLMLPLLAFALAGHIRFASGLIPLREAIPDPSDYFGLLLFTTVVWAIVLEQFGLNRFDLLFAVRSSAKTAFWACVATYVAVTGLTFFYRSASFSRLFVAISACALFLLVVLAQHMFRALLKRARRQGNNCTPVLIIGADQFAARAARAVLRAPVPCTVVGFVRLPGQEVEVREGPVFELHQVRELARGAEIGDVVIAITPARFGEVPVVMSHLESLCVPVRLMLDLGEKTTIREMLFDFGGLPMLDLQAAPTESVMYMMAKRAFDLVFSTCAILVTAPLTALIAAAVRLTSPGPVIFAQERVGLNGRLFRMFKFRTMRFGEQAESDTRWTTPDDPRRTGLGAFLRRTNLDELPQLFNVLSGDMSIVGPRPERPHFVQKFVQEVAQYNTRHYLKVGMTGWAQVNGWRGDTSIARRVEHDLYYLRHWSLLLDLKIIFLTLWRGAIANRNAY